MSARRPKPHSKSASIASRTLVAAAKAAVEEGIIPGGGSAIVQAAKVLDELADTLPNDEALGVQVVATALNAPPHWIATNAGLDGAVVSKVADAESDMASTPPP